MKKIQIISILTALLTLASTACGQNNSGQNNKGTSSAQCAPLETATANAPDQRPAFPGQTRVCGVKSNTPFEVTTLAKGLRNPWAVEPLPDGSFLITEKAGQMRIVSAKGEVGEPIGGLLPVGAGAGVSESSGQGGLPPITAR